MTIRVSILLDRTVYVAGNDITGTIRIKANPGLPLNLSFSLTGNEEIQEENKHYITKFFEVTQNVQEELRVEKKKLFIPFKIETPPNLPSSFDNLKSSIKYTIASRVIYQGQVINTTKECIVVEKLSPDEFQKSKFASFGRSSKKVTFGGDGQLNLQCHLHKSFYKAGDIVYTTIFVQNQTKRKVKGVRMTLIRKTTWQTDQKTTKEKILLEKEFVQEDFRFYPGENKEILIEFPLPNDIRRINKAPRTKVNFFLKISLVVVLSQNCSIEMPIEICHPASIEPPPAPGIFLSRPISSNSFDQTPDDVESENIYFEEDSHASDNGQWVLVGSQTTPSPSTTPKQETNQNKGKAKENEDKDKDLEAEVRELSTKKAVAILDFETSEQGEISFKKDDVIELSVWEGEWWEGRNTSTSLCGKFPSNFVQIV